MKSLIAASLLLFSTVSFASSTIESIKEFSCVADAEYDSLFHTLSADELDKKSTKILVSVKDGQDVAACADEVSSELGLKLDHVFSITPLFVVSKRPSLGGPIAIVPVLPIEEEVFKCLAIGGICD